MTIAFVAEQGVLVTLWLGHTGRVFSRGPMNQAGWGRRGTPEGAAAVQSKTMEETGLQSTCRYTE